MKGNNFNKKFLIFIIRICIIFLQLLIYVQILKQLKKI